MIRALFDRIGFSAMPRTAEEWVVRSQARRLSAREAREFDRWLAVEANRRELERVKGIGFWGAYLRSKPEVASRMEVFRTLEHPRALPTRAPADAPRLRWTLAAAATACAAVLLVIGLPRMPASALDSVATARGEQRSVRLEDGSQVMVNTDSSIRVSYSGDERRVLLARGEAYFEVVKDPGGRKFVVQTGDTEVRVLGTKFSVRATGSRTDVIVSEGKVEVVPNAARSSRDTPAKVELVPGNALRIDRNENQVLIAGVDPERATAWRTGTVFFEDTALEDVVAELNRYSTKPFVIANDRVKDVRMTGAFRIGDSAAVRFALKDAFGIESSFEGDRILLR